MRKWQLKRGVFSDSTEGRAANPDPEKRNRKDTGEWNPPMPPESGEF